MGLGSLPVSGASCTLGIVSWCVPEVTKVPLPVAASESARLTALWPCTGAMATIAFEEVLRKLKLRDADVVSCYLWGSRLWGTAKDR